MHCKERSHIPGQAPSYFCQGKMRREGIITQNRKLAKEKNNVLPLGGSGIQNNFFINSTGTLRNLNNIARQKLKFPLLLKDTVRAIARFGCSLQKKLLPPPIYKQVCTFFLLPLFPSTPERI